MNGKSKCKILKEIRKQIAAKNDIEYITTECKHKGDCRGTCPKCEEEVRYLEEQLCLRRRAGKAVALTGIAATLFVTGCAANDTASEDTNFTSSQIEETSTQNEWDGVPYPPEESVYTTMGELLPESESSLTDVTVDELMGDIPYIPEQ